MRNFAWSGTAAPLVTCERKPARAPALLLFLVCTVALLAPQRTSLAARSPAPVTDACAGGGWPNRLDPAAWIDSAALSAHGFGKLTFKAGNGKSLTAYVYRASAFAPKQSPIWFVMHGVKRDAQAYLQAAASVAERYGVLAVAIEFSKRDYPRQEDYALGVTTHGKASERALSEGRWRKPEHYAYTEVERLYAAIRSTLAGAQSGYYLFGHSAGAQFVHRLLTFVPCARVLGAVAANAGWYTLPATRLAVPYGVRGSPLKESDLHAVWAAPLTVLLGTLDTNTPTGDDNLRATPEAMAQGSTRLARGMHYFETAKANAAAMNARFGWRLVLAPGATHSVSEVVASAGFLLFSQRPLCEPSSAAAASNLIFNEVLADPPRGAEGDANLDRSREAAEDEFVEIVNAGSASVCLAGWRLSDASGRGTHLFPHGAALEPGKAVVIFGGGVPVGRFGGAQVQCSTNAQLSLSSEGDVLSLRDARGALARQMSWGNCDRQACAKDHYSGDLALRGSIVRAQEPLGAWQRHQKLAKAGLSPGVKTNGAQW